MPFLDLLAHWAAERPGAIAVAVGTERLSYSELRDRAAARVPAAGALTILCSPNSVEFAVRFAAGVAGSRACAVLDPAWPATQRELVTERLRQTDTAHLGVGAGLGSGLTDGPPDSPFLYGFTSGTTAVPKACTRTRASWDLAASAEFFGLTAFDRTLAPGPLSATLTLYALAESLHSGGTFVTLPHFDAGDALASVAEHAITRIVAVPTILGMISGRALAAGLDGSGITSLVSAGAPLDPPTLERLRRWAPNAAIFEYYGAAELSFVAGSQRAPGAAGESTGREPVGVGRAFPGVDIRILNDAGDTVPTGTPGTIHVRSPYVSAGYVWGDDGLAFRATEDWCTVGDQGVLDEDGSLHVRGRRADMLVTAGHNVYPQEIEAALLGVPGVHAVVATGLFDPARGIRIVAAVQGSADAAALRAACSALLPGAKRPRAYYSLAELPVTGAGKPSRRLLARWIEEDDPRVRPLH